MLGAAADPAPAMAPGPSTVALRSDLERLIASPGWAGDEWSVTVVSLDRRDTLFSHGSDTPLAPASNLKLFTTTAALYYLGPDYRYSTYVLANGAVRSGVVEGDLVLYGTGDPSLSFRFHGNSAAVMRAFADSLVAQGIREVRGDVVGDGSYFSGPRSGSGWDLSYIGASYAVPADALSLNENLITLRVSPAAQAGWRPVVEAMPGGTGIAVVNEATTVARGGTSIDIRRDAYDGPLVIRGRIRRGGGTITRVVPVADPAQYAAAALRQALEQRGVTVTGQARSVHDAAQSPVTGRAVFAPAFQQGTPAHVLTIYRSPPLIDILDILMHLSHNMFAEQTLRTVGRVALGEGSIEAGYRAVQNMLHCETGSDSLTLQMYDGSGLSPLNRTSSRSIVRLLSFAATSPIYEPLFRTLPEAGHPHLLRMFQTAAQNNLRAKTGTIDRVSSLSGFVRAANGERLAFSIISNGDPSTWKAKRVEDAIGARLASFSRPGVEAPLAETEPAVATPAPAPAPAAPAQSVAPPGSPAAPPAPATRAAPPAQPVYHTVSRGETLDRIARKYGTTVAALQAANPGLEPRRIRPGQQIVVSDPGAPAPAPSADRPTAAPRARTPARPQASAPSGRARSYTIRKGDTLSEIAERFGVSVRALQRANPGLSARRIQPGKRLRIPAS
ncbi:MAG TPA: D-alanyl-D-alanine carboxypeptidase/D-alanyl-D-alanine-endopeptidase [Longimicrobiales bacterium]|nr:D-alanyl-D-alanine carboxypeptidase/D-alanyl-D-alanine-endopeptidase [Longimicrobiales bacterium]